MEGASEMMWIGIGILFAQVFFGTYTNILVKKNQGRVRPFMLASFSMLVGGICLFILSVFVEGFKVESYPTEYFISLGWLSFLSAADFSIWYNLLQRPEVKVSDVNTWKFIIPVSGAILGWSLMPNESPDFVSIIGMVIIAAGLLLLNFTNRMEIRRKRK